MEDSYTFRAAAADFHDRSLSRGKTSPDALRRSAFPGSFFASVVSCNGIGNPIFFRLLVGFLASLVTAPGASGNAQV